MILFLNIFTLIVLAVTGLSILPHLPFIMAVPLLPLFFILTLSYFRKGFEPILIAALAGVAYDFFSSYPFGFYLVFFLLAAVSVKLLFQEGMNSLSFWYFFGLSMTFVVLFYGVQYFYLMAFLKLPFTLTALWPFILGLIFNAVCAILFYVFAVYYFDRIFILEDHLKRR